MYMYDIYLLRHCSINQCSKHVVIIIVTNARIQTKEVVRMAMMVPVGIDLDASARSPERFDPAMIPKHTNTPHCSTPLPISYKPCRRH